MLGMGCPDSSLNSRAGYSNVTTSLVTKNSYNNHKKGKLCAAYGTSGGGQDLVGE